MKAWQSTTTHEPLSLTEVPAWLAVLAKTPITMGHENAGVVAAVGEGVTEVTVGDRVGVCPTMGKLEATIDTQAMIMNAVTFKGNKGGTKEDVAGIYEDMATGKLNPTITTIGFDEISGGIEKLKNGEVVGRLVAFYE